MGIPSAQSPSIPPGRLYAQPAPPVVQPASAIACRHRFLWSLGATATAMHQTTSLGAITVVEDKILPCLESNSLTAGKIGGGRSIDGPCSLTPTLRVLHAFSYLGKRALTTMSPRQMSCFRLGAPMLMPIIEPILLLGKLCSMSLKMFA